MSKYVAIGILFISLLIEVSAQETQELNLPNELYFLYTTSRNSLYSVQDDTNPIEVFSRRDPIRSYQWSPDGSKIVIVGSEAGTGTKYTAIYTANFQLLQRFELEYYNYCCINSLITWTPDSESLRLVYPSPQILSISISNPDERSTIPIPLLETEEIEQVYWSPDDDWIAIGTIYYAYGDVRLFKYETGEEFVITIDGLPFSRPMWRSRF